MLINFFFDEHLFHDGIFFFYKKTRATSADIFISLSERNRISQRSRVHVSKHFKELFKIIVFFFKDNKMYPNIKFGFFLPHTKKRQQIQKYKKH